MRLRPDSATDFIGDDRLGVADCDRIGMWEDPILNYAEFLRRVHNTEVGVSQKCQA